METWEVALKEHVMDNGCDVADITMANCVRCPVLLDLSADIQKMSHIVRYGDLKKNLSSTKLVCDCVTTRSAQRVTQMVSNHWTRASLSIVMTRRHPVEEFVETCRNTYPPFVVVYLFFQCRPYVTRIQYRENPQRRSDSFSFCIDADNKSAKW